MYSVGVGVGVGVILTNTRLIEHLFLFVEAWTNFAAKLVDGLSAYATVGNICTHRNYTI